MAENGAATCGLVRGSQRWVCSAGRETLLAHDAA